jgi:AcrR family transcriptional regulator
MRTRILRAALGVFAEKGPDAPVIDDFVRAAGIARGTFYNHFEGVQELLRATSVWTIEETIASIVQSLREYGNRPLLRFGMGIRLFLHRARLDASWGGFVAKTWSLGRLAAPRRDVAEGVRLGAFRVPSLEPALDVVFGALREAMLRMASGAAPRGYEEQVVEVCLHALGAKARGIAEVLGQPLPQQATGKPSQGVSSSVDGVG